MNSDDIDDAIFNAAQSTLTGTSNVPHPADLRRLRKRVKEFLAELPHDMLVQELREIME